ncbi:ABC transporter ATP-binding protein [Halobacillus salinus]|uniref:ABC transporter ATP-binding protein n=1 Tax=Halobacillus salinus TaxID=192814 RepID=A0A4Z0GZX1_9BACI|nr:ABC transporter ATP-binding protein [Halobacillus salinus]TGB03743.1 ABC transporter ATP-binding protein [Halobacillus salinus]
MQSITCENLTKSFKGDGVETFALQNIHVTFQQSDFTAMIGPSGSGKSTLLSIIGTLDEPSNGKVLYGGEHSPRKSNAVANFRFEHIGFIFQQYHLLPTLTALENVLSPVMTRKVDYDKTARAKELLDRVGLAEKAGSLPSQLSGGQQQRVAIARALIQEPDWLLADEPTGNLDSETGEMVFQLLQEIHREKGCGVLFVTHDETLAERADQVVRMVDGKIVSE